MAAFSSVLVCVVFSIVCLLHIAAFWLDKYGKIISFVNIALHIFLFFLLLKVGAPIDEALLIYMISALVYALASFVKYRVGRSKR